MKSPIHLILTGALGTAASLAALTATSAVACAATTVLVIPGTGTKDPAPVPGYLEHSIQYYVSPTGACEADGCVTKPVPYIAEFGPLPFEGWGGPLGTQLDDSVASGISSAKSVYEDTDSMDSRVVFGYSQGATVASELKRELAAKPGGVPENVSFVAIANPSRPNGGIFQRLAPLKWTGPAFGATFGRSSPTRTSANVNTTDIALQYDGVTDFPTYPTNVLATANAMAGFMYSHGTYLSPKDDDTPTATPLGYHPHEVADAVRAAKSSCTADTHCQVSGDTRYITLPAPILPLALPLIEHGPSSAMRPLVDFASPIARTAIETGYTRDDYARPTPLSLDSSNAPTPQESLAASVTEGLHAAITGTGDASRYLDKRANQNENSPTPADDETAGTVPQNAQEDVVTTVRSAVDELIGIPRTK
ncbi:PE-PPE domain-containing protein [Gordonia sp. MP11Mi]|uniref:PE-PPE domain-containing protein n=1 Tax=Gordonia sp. MP11Mi TaxID=3022769 RepID=A0AA97GWN1_9ACTN